jgi:signal transduction histidine kinase
MGGIGLSFAEPQNFARKDRAFMTVLARQCAQAMERARLYEAEQVAQKDLALLAETRERNRLAQDLHDNVAQALGYLNLKMTVTNELLASGQVEEAAANLRELKQVIGETYTDVREEIFDLRAKAYSGISFLEMLDRYIDKYKRFYNLDIQLIQEADLALFEFPQEVSPQIMRTVQEALINVRKHARINQATIRLSETNNHLYITVEDKGQGFDLAAIKGAGTSSFGLQIMQERVRRVGGALEIKTAPGQGTQIILRYAKPEGRSHPAPVGPHT